MEADVTVHTFYVTDALKRFSQASNNRIKESQPYVRRYKKVLVTVFNRFVTYLKIRLHTQEIVTVFVKKYLQYLKHHFQEQ
jgi:hypothetical protein